MLLLNKVFDVLDLKMLVDWSVFENNLEDLNEDKGLLDGDLNKLLDVLPVALFELVNREEPPGLVLNIFEVPVLFEMLFFQNIELYSVLFWKSEEFDWLLPLELNRFREDEKLLAGETDGYFIYYILGLFWENRLFDEDALVEKGELKEETPPKVVFLLKRFELELKGLPPLAYNIVS